MIRKSQLILLKPESEVINRPPKEFKFDGEIDPGMLSNVLHDRMKELGGIGLSANQVGLDMAVFVLGAGDVKMSVFNPQIHKYSEEEVSLDEGCLTFPGVYLKVKRPVSCDVSYRNEKGELIRATLSGLTARIFQHEYDHMIGTLFRDRVSDMKWDFANKKVIKKNKKIAKNLTQKLFKQIREDIKHDNR